MTARLLDAPVAPLTSSLPDLGCIPLGKVPSAKAALSETLNRVLPAPESQPLSVAAFNSSI